MIDNEYEIFSGKSFRDLCKDIYTNQLHRNTQIGILINDLSKLIKKPDDTVIIMPIIKGLVDAANINDQQLIRLAGIIQKLMVADQQSVGGDAMGLTEEERKNLLNEVNAEIDTIKKSNVIIDTTIISSDPNMDITADLS